MHQNCYTKVSIAKNMYIWKPTYLSIFKSQLQKLSKKLIQNVQIIVQDSKLSYKLEYIKCESLLKLNFKVAQFKIHCLQRGMEYFKTFQNLFLITSKIWYMKLCITKLALDFMNNTYTLLFKPFHNWAASSLQLIFYKNKNHMHYVHQKKEKNNKIP